ncbi:hypothetical protein RRG08_019056 [Elysia crispata]|uniref:Uncharacterized protein n=1 Tax=Elysia crispata TaxID=231223 RepID=A0AAE1A595_9GAST|nr:hypothetical protein RRG08_019056 [Elysia crispata]
MWTVVVLSILPCIAVASDCVALKQCEAPIRATHFFLDENAMVPNMNGEDILNDVCSKLPAMKTCISTRKKFCMSVKENMEVKIFGDIIDYMCTPEGRQVILDLDKTPCKDDPLFGMKFEGLMMGCLATFQSGIKADFEAKKRPLTNEERCPYIYQLDKCVVDDTKKMCGQEMATYVDKIWEISTKEGFKAYDCALTHAHKRRYLEAAMPIIKRSRLL